MREAPNLGAKKIGLIPYGEQVLLIEETGAPVAISGITGRWSKINWKGKAGWVFGGFLTGYNDKTTGETDGDSLFIQGDIAEKGRPVIIITHFTTEFYNPPEGTTEITSGSGKLEVVKVDIPKSPQTYSRREVYYLKNGKMFMIQMQDVDNRTAVEFYNTWLSGFKP
ncbi:MAG: SH3 domain-containing protein [Spirochaetales bacterium]|nr:SH3 domain-containing protein [Spirochaetales bacterium]